MAGVAMAGAPHCLASHAAAGARRPSRGLSILAISPIARDYTLSSRLGMSEQRLNHANVLAALEADGSQSCGEAKQRDRLAQRRALAASLNSRRTDASSALITATWKQPLVFGATPFLDVVGCAATSQYRDHRASCTKRKTGTYAAGGSPRLLRHGGSRGRPHPKTASRPNTNGCFQVAVIAADDASFGDCQGAPKPALRKTVSLHSLRHSFATHLLSAARHSRDSSVARHSKPETTARYSRVRSD